MSKKLNSIPLAILMLTLILATSGCAAGPTGGNNAALALSPPQFQPPVSGDGISIGSWGPDDGDHKGPDYYAIDYIGPDGTPIKAALAGVVVFSGWADDGYGYVVAIRHSDPQTWDQNYYSIYAHLHQEGLLAVGTTVDTNTIIGNMGQTGTTSVHLHFAVRSSTEVYDGTMALYGQSLSEGKIYTPAFNVQAQFGLNP